MKAPATTGLERHCQPLGAAARFGLIGHPIAGSGSPALFAKAYGGRWPYDLIDREHFEDAWAEFLRGYRAVNITAPFKEIAFRRVLEFGRVDASCLEIGAINIAVKTPDGIVGYNSDFLGVRKVLMDNGFVGTPDAFCTGEVFLPSPAENSHLEGPQAGDCGRRAVERSDLAASAAPGYIRGGAPNDAAEGPQAGDCGRRAVIAGFGGAGKAAAAAARSLGLDVVVCNRSRRGPGIHPLEDLPALAAAADILIYCLPFPIPEIDCLLNTAADADGEVPAQQGRNTRGSIAGGPSRRDGGVSPEGKLPAGQAPPRWKPGLCILEANYRTPCLSGFRGRYIHGSAWLEAQATLGYPLMTGFPVEA